MGFRVNAGFIFATGLIISGGVQGCNEPQEKDYPNSSPGRCPLGQFDCLNTDPDPFCIPFSAVRDCIADCPLGHDEVCGTKLTLCDAGVKHGNSQCGKCVKPKETDKYCVDRKWQNLCNEPNVRPCNSTKNCVHEKWLNDGEDDCGDGSDESCPSGGCRQDLHNVKDQITKPKFDSKGQRAGNKTHPADCAEMLLDYPHLTGMALKKAFNWRCRSPEQCGFPVLCDFELFGGGWTVLLQRRFPPQIYFNRTYAEYRQGLGLPHSGTEFWLGLDRIHALTANRMCVNELVVVMTTARDGRKLKARYETFVVAGETEQYRLELGALLVATPDFDAVDGLLAARGRPFLTVDRRSSPCENDPGGWWADQGDCGGSGATVPFLAKDSFKGLRWGELRLVEVSYLIRPKGFTAPV